MTVKLRVSGDKAVIEEGQDTLVGKLLAAGGKLKVNNPRARRTLTLVDELPEKKVEKPVKPAKK